MGGFNLKKLKQFNKKYLVLMLILLIIAGIYTFLSFGSVEVISYYAEDGELGLENWDMKLDEIISLNGDWLFYPNQFKQDLNSESQAILQTVPHSWESDPQLNSPYGYGTYQLYLTGLKPMQAYGVYIIDEVIAYSFYANDELIASNGHVSDQRETYRPQWKPILAVFHADKNGNAELVMEIANFDYYRGGFWNSPRIGAIDTLFSGISKEKSRELFFFTVIIIVGLMNFALFTVYKNDLTTLYFSLFCFSIGFRTVLIGQRIITDSFPNIPWNVSVRMEYLLGYLMLPFFGLFIIYFLEKNPYEKLQRYFFYGFIIICTFITLISSNEIYTEFLEPYKWLALFYTLYFTYRMFRIQINKQTGALLMLFGILGIIISIIKEIFIGGLISWIPFATLHFIICFSLLTIQRFLRIIKKNQILEAKIIRDPLTGLFNRSYLMEIEDYLVPIKSYSKYLMFLDLDQFKKINDTYGHKIGDFILQEAGIRFNSVLQNKDILCRYGGDEFIIILIVEDYEEVINIAQKIINSIQVPFEKEGVKYQVGVSIGIVESKAQLHDIDSLIRYGDEAMYEAKKRGGNQYKFYPI